MTTSDDFIQAADQAAQQSRTPIKLDGITRVWPWLPVARYRLDNGLTVLLAPDSRAEIFTYQTWFRVGSRHEDPERTGLAHMFEHLMFKGTKTYPTGVFDKEMEKRGCQTNAATWVDWTYYTQSLAARADHLETVVAFEADRMVNLDLTEAVFASEREVVKNERRQHVEDSISGAMSEKLFSTAYQQHPYRWPTIGAMDHLNATELHELEAFYRTYYAPNNATVVVVGDFELSNVLALIAKAYGPLASQPIPHEKFDPEPPQRAFRPVELNFPTLSPHIALGFHIPAQHHPDTPAVEILSEILTGGDTGRLYHRLVTQEELAVDVEDFVSPFAQPGLYELIITLREDARPEAAVDIVFDEMTRLGEGIHDHELEKAVNSLEVSFWDEFRTTEGCAENLGHFETNFSDFALAFAPVKTWPAVDPEDLTRVSQTMFARSNASCIVVRPYPA